MLDIKDTNGEYNVSTWKSKGIYNSGLKPLHDLVSFIKHFGCQVGLQLLNSVLVVKQNNHPTKFVNVFIVYKLDNWPENLLNNFVFKKCLFGATNIVKNSDKSKYFYKCY